MSHHNLHHRLRLLISALGLCALIRNNKTLTGGGMSLLYTDTSSRAITSQQQLQSSSSSSSSLDHDKDSAGEHTLDDRKQNRTRISMIIKLGGEMANNLSYIAHAFGIKLAIEREHPNLEIDLVAEHQKHSKWIGGRDALQGCFPKLGFLTFKAGVWDPAYFEIKALQQELFNPNGLTSIDNECGRGEHDCWRDSVTFIERALQTQRDYPTNTTLEYLQPQMNLTNSTEGMTLPYLISDKMSYVDPIIDEFYNEIRELFVMDEEKCCDLRPDHDETVFHLRNFAKEGKYLYTKGLEELDPNRTATELLGHLKPGDKVSIVTRFPTAKNVLNYREAFKRQGFNASILESRSGTHDFCYLKSATKELIVAKVSTYGGWAGLLSNTSRVVYYMVENQYSRKRKSSLFGHQFNWTTMELRNKINDETYTITSR